MAFADFNPFNRSNPQPAPAQQQQQQPTLPASQQAANGQPANSNFQNQTGAPTGGNGNPAPATNPMDEFNSLFGVGQSQGGNGMAAPPQQMTQQPGGNQAPAGPQYDGYTVPWDDTAMRGKFANVKFSQTIPQELKERIKAGDSDAMFEALDHVGRESFLNATRASHGLIDRGVKTGLDKFGGSLDDRLRDYNIRNQNTDNEVFNHPAVAPTFQAMKSFIAQQNPKLSAQEVASQSEKWFMQMSSALQAKQSSQQGTQNQPKMQDWEASFGASEMDDGGNNQVQGF